MKTTLYVLPGLMCNEKLWDKLIALLPDTYEFVALRIPLKTSFDDMVEELAFLLPKKPVLLLGFSLGGYVASYFTVKYPKRVAKLFILSSSCKPIPKEEILKREQAISLVHTYGFKGLSTQKVQSLLQTKNQNNEALIELIQQMYKDMGKDAFNAQMQASLKRQDLMQALSQLPVPISLCCSQYDRLVDVHWLKTLVHKNPNIHLTLFQSNSHMLPLEKPKELAREIQKWVDFT